MKDKKLTYRVIAVWILILAAVLGYILFFVMGDFKYGLDLSGGTSLTYIADVSKINQINKEASQATTTISTTTGQTVGTIDSEQVSVKDSMNGLREIVEQRVNKFGVAEPVIYTEYSSYTNQHRLVVELPGITNLDQAIKMIGDTPKLEFKLVEDASSTGEISSSTKLADTGLDGSYLKKAVFNFDSVTGQPEVLIIFNKQGQDLFASLTKNNIGKRVAIFLDGNSISAPVINEEIPGGQATISGGFTVDQAKELVTRLNSGALPVNITLSSSQVVEPTLGTQAKADGLLAGEIALAIIIILMILWYRLPGLLASISLVIYVTLMLFLFKSIPVVLTAAGIAGFIISIGIAIDGNILIFERLKEELRRGKDLREASEEAFRRAWTSIRDSNIASIIVALILFYFGSALLKGFGLVFGLGVLVSMFSAMVISKYFIRALVVADKNSKAYKVISFLFKSGFKK